MPTPQEFEDLIALQTVTTHRDAVQSAGETVDVNLEDLPPLDPLKVLLLQALPIAVSQRDGLVNQAIRGGFKDFATGPFLALNAENVYGLEGGYLPETFARTEVTFTNATAGEFTFGALELILQVTGTDKEFNNEAAFTLKPTGDAGGGDVVTVFVIAKEPGSDYDAPAGTLETMVPAIDGVTLTNANAATASNGETEAQLRTRCDDALGPLSPGGPIEVYRDIARNTYLLEDGFTYVWTHSPGDYPGAVNLGITRVQVVENVPDLGDIKVYLATDASVPSAPQIAAVHALFLLWGRPGSAALLPTAAATLDTINIAYSALYRTRFGVTEEQLTTFVQDALEAFFADDERNPMGGVIIPPATAGTLFRTEISEVISAARGAPDSPAPIKNISALTPGSDTAVAVGHLPVLGTVTPTFTAIP